MLVVGLAAAVGAGGGATLAIVDNTARTCMEEAEKKEKDEKPEPGGE